MNELTQSEAERKWCPFARIAARTAADSADHGCNRSFDGNGAPNPKAHCLGSGCMAWRSLGTVYRGERYTPDDTLTDDGIRAFGTRMRAEGRQPDATSATYLGIHQVWHDRAEQGGYCGLAGRIA